MDSKKCSNVIQVGGPFKQEKICNATQFYDSGAGEQCPKFCGHCGAIINPLFDETRESIIDRDDGPTLIEWVKSGESVDNYPPIGFKAKPYTKAEYKEAVKIEDEEEKPAKATGAEVKEAKASHAVGAKAK